MSQISYFLLNSCKTYNNSIYLFSIFLKKSKHGEKWNEKRKTVPLLLLNVQKNSSVENLQ